MFFHMFFFLYLAATSSLCTSVYHCCLFPSAYPLLNSSRVCAFVGWDEYTCRFACRRLARSRLYFLFVFFRFLSLVFVLSASSECVKTRLHIGCRRCSCCSGSERPSARLCISFLCVFLFCFFPSCAVSLCYELTRFSFLFFFASFLF